MHLVGEEWGRPVALIRHSALIVSEQVHGTACSACVCQRTCNWKGVMPSIQAFHSSSLAVWCDATCCCVSIGHLRSPHGTNCQQRRAVAVQLTFATERASTDREHRILEQKAAMLSAQRSTSSTESDSFVAQVVIHVHMQA